MGRWSTGAITTGEATRIESLVLRFTLHSIFSQDLYVTDGDTIKINGERIGLIFIDTPGSNQSDGLESKEYLSMLIKGKDIKIIRESKHRYGTTIAWLIVEGDTVNYKMVEEGFAKWYEYDCANNITLATLQNKAKINKIGLWKDLNPIKPVKWKKFRINCFALNYDLSDG